MDPKSFFGAFRGVFLRMFGARNAVTDYAIGVDHQLSRFIWERHKYRGPDEVRPKAFEPQFDRERERYETSLFHTHLVSEPEIWALGKDHVSTAVGKPMLARGDLIASVIRQEGLSLLPDQPPPRHVVIVGWPDEKERRKDIQNALAAEATLVLAPTVHN